jgi:hypothetical protein
MLTTVEGIYKDGKVELLEQPVGVQEARIIVTFLAGKNGEMPVQMLQFGKYAGLMMSSEDDFKAAEWHGEPEFDE